MDDLLRATKKLKVLGTGFTVIQFKSGRCLVQSVPGEMSLDQVCRKCSLKRKLDFSDFHASNWQCTMNFYWGPAIRLLFLAYFLIFLLPKPLLGINIDVI